jgi:maltose alpha-D-glucosyltransferase/alpha-amylase
MKRMLEVRKQHPLFGTGTLEFLSAENPSVLAYVREQTTVSEPGAGAEGPQESTDIVLCVNNLSRFAQPVELAMQRWEGKTPIELMGRVPFPRIGELPYFVTLGPYAFYWFQLVEHGQ